MAKKIKTAGILGAIFFLIYAFIAYSVDISTAIITAINSCLTIIIPSLFGFLVLSGFLVKSGLYAILGKPFGIISRYIFKIPEQFFSVFLISLFAGYPIGAKLLADLRDSGDISEKDASDLLCCCYTSGPTFVIGLVGSRLFNSIRVGLVLYLSLVLTNIIIAIILGIFKKVPPKSQKKTPLKLSASALIESVENGAKSLFLVCVTIVFFAIILAVLRQFFDIPTLFAAFLEISSLAALPRTCLLLLPQIAAAFSFGGVCVILQIVAIVGDRISLGKFIATRVISTLLAAFVCSKLTFLLGDIAVLVSMSIQPTIAPRQSPPAASVCLIIMTVMLLSVKKKKAL